MGIFFVVFSRFSGTTPRVGPIKDPDPLQADANPHHSIIKTQNFTIMSVNKIKGLN